jgi:hypothetical protein
MVVVHEPGRYAPLMPAKVYIWQVPAAQAKTTDFAKTKKAVPPDKLADSPSLPDILSAIRHGGNG